MPRPFREAPARALGATRDGASVPSGFATPGELATLTQLLAASQSRARPEDLARHFPSIGHVVSAPPARLEGFGINARDLALLRAVRDTAQFMARADVAARPVIGSFEALLRYCTTAMAYDTVETVRVFYLDRKLALIADEQHSRGTVHHTPVYPREIAKRALVLDASSVILAHNHPSGDPKPSRDDIEMTRDIKKALATVDIDVNDHIIVGHGRHASFNALGLL
jgi:DNA repair protein RadC